MVNTHYDDLDIFGIAETFLQGNTVLTVDGYTWYGQNRKHLHDNARRGSGGVGCFVKSTLLNSYSVSILNSDTEGILWLRLDAKMSNDCICLCVCYLPPENSSRAVDGNSFYDKLFDHICTYQNTGDLIICGDFNGRCGMLQDYIEGVDDVPPRDILDESSNRYGNLLLDLLTDTNLCMLNGRVGSNNNFTSISHRGSAVIDYALVPQEQLNRVIDFSVLCMTTLITDLNLVVPCSIPGHSVLMWDYRVTAVQSGSETDDNPGKSKKRFQVNDIPTSYMNNPDVIEALNVTIRKLERELEHKNDVSRAYKTFTEFVQTEMEKHIQWKNVSVTRQRNTKSMYKPYWNDELGTQWSEVKLCESEWLKSKSNGATRRRLKEKFCDERRKFDKINRKYKRKFQIAKQHELADLCDQNGGNTRNFWKYIGKLGVSNERKSKIPWEVVEDGQTVTDVNKVLHRWKTEYEHLFSESTNPIFNDDFLDSVRESNITDIQECAPAVDNASLNVPISREEVQNVISKAKVRKAAGLDDIPAEVLKNNICVELLHKLITYCFENGEIPNDWKTGIITPIPKSNDKDPRDPMSYRGLTILSIPCKLYSAILNDRLCNWLEDSDLLADEQNGFRKKRSCEDHLYTLCSIINNRKTSRKSTFGCFVDAKKAFDTVNRDLLWYKLHQIGVRGKMLSALQSLYHDIKCTVRLNNTFTDTFPIHSGVKQGCNLSPTLYSVYINDLAEDIRNSGLGVHIDDFTLGILMYADDIVLIAETESDLHKLLDILDRWCRRWRLTINQEKTKVVHFRSANKPRSDVDFKCGDIDIAYSTNYKYLGLWLDEHLNMQCTVNELAKSASRALGALISKFSYAGGMTFDVFDKLFKCLVEPVMNYGSSIWGISKQPKLEAVKNKAARFFLGVRRNTANLAVLGDMGWTQNHVLQKTAVIRYWNRLCNTDNDRMLYKVHSWSMRYGRSWEGRVRKMLLDMDVNPNTIINVNTAKNIFIADDRDKWRAGVHNQDIHNKLRTYRLFKTEPNTENYVKNRHIHREDRRSLAQFRCGSAPLKVETGRYTKPVTPIDLRLCELCNFNVTEDEKHFLLSCPFYDDIRDELFNEVTMYNQSFCDLSTDEKFTYILGNDNIQKVLARTVNKIV